MFGPFSLATFGLIASLFTFSLASAAEPRCYEKVDELIQQTPSLIFKCRKDQKEVYCDHARTMDRALRRCTKVADLNKGLDVLLSPVRSESKYVDGREASRIERLLLDMSTDTNNSQLERLALLVSLNNITEVTIANTLYVLNTSMLLNSKIDLDGIFTSKYASVEEMFVFAERKLIWTYKLQNYLGVQVRICDYLNLEAHDQLTRLLNPKFKKMVEMRSPSEISICNNDDQHGSIMSIDPENPNYFDE